jgi:hypothetical protein
MEDRNMSELAFNLNGDPFDVPPSAVGWRVRKMKTKGAPEVAYGRNGQPLVLPLEADVDDLRAEVGTAGRYRLDPIDDQNKPIANASAGYVMVHELAQAPAATVNSATTYVPTVLAPLPSPSDNVVIEAMRMNAEITRLMVDRFPQMMESTAVLLRAADGAGLPARPGMAEDDDEDDGGGDHDADDRGGAQRGGGLDIGALLKQAAPLLLALASGKIDVGSMFDWSKAAKKGAAERKASAVAASAPTAAAAASTVEPTAEQQLLSDPAAMQHFVAILNGLTPDESRLARAVAQELSATEQLAWLKELKTLSVGDATHKVRELLATMVKSGGAS